MIYEVIFGYDPNGSVEYSRDFNIDSLDNNALTFDNIDEFIKYVKYLEESSEYIIDNQKYNLTTIDDMIDTTNNKHVVRFNIMHPDDNGEEELDDSDLNSLQKQFKQMCLGYNLY